MNKKGKPQHVVCRCVRCDVSVALNFIHHWVTNKCFLDFPSQPTSTTVLVCPALEAVINGRKLGLREAPQVGVPLALLITGLKPVDTVPNQWQCDVLHTIEHHIVPHQCDDFVST